MHHYEMGIDSSAAFLQAGGARRHREDQGHRGRLEDPPRAAALWRRRCCRKSSPRCSRRRSSSRRSACAKAFSIRCCRTRSSATDPLISAVGGTGAAARPLGRPMRVSWSTGPANRLPPSASTRPRKRARYRHAACLLADIGWRAHPEYRGTQSLNIIAHASFIGVDHPGRAVPGAGQRLPPRRRLQRRDRAGTEGAGDAALSGAGTAAGGDDARRLSADGVDAGRHAAAEWEKRDNGALALVIPASLAGLYGERPAGRLAQLAKVTGRKLELVVGVDQAESFSRMPCVDRPARRGRRRPRPESRRRWRCPSSAPAVHEGQHRIVAALAVMADEAGRDAEGGEQQRSGARLEADQDEQRRRSVRTGRSPRRPVSAPESRALRNSRRCRRCRRACDSPTGGTGRPEAVGRKKRCIGGHGRPEVLRLMPRHRYALATRRGSVPERQTKKPGSLRAFLRFDA